MKRFTIVQNGYNVEEVNRFIDIVIKYVILKLHIITNIIISIGQTSGSTSITAFFITKTISFLLHINYIFFLLFYQYI